MADPKQPPQYQYQPPPAQQYNDQSAYSQPAYAQHTHVQPGYAQPGYAQQPHGQPGYAQPTYPPQGSYHQQQHVYTPPPGQVVIIQDACINGGHHVIEKSFDCCGIFLAIFFFPIGLLCCFLMASNKCMKCGKQFP